LGSHLGNSGINIASFHLGRKEEGGDAICLVEVDGALPPEVVRAVSSLPQVRQAKALVF
jgi:D-3-phosphoglycerate dehydrogenase